MNSLTKQDQILARKAYEARKMKDIKDFNHGNTAPRTRGSNASPECQKKMKPRSKKSLLSENKFMPKVIITKDHGISLRDQYAAKCEDVWGKLQLCQSGLDHADREDEIRLDRAKKNFTREDIVKQIKMRKDHMKKERDYEASQGWGSQSEMLKRIAADEEYRVKLNNENRKVFARNINEDMVKSMRRRKKVMARELEDGHVIVARALHMQALEQARRDAKRKYEAERNKRVQIENEKDLEFKRKIIQKQLLDDKEVLRVAEMVANERERKRQEALEKKHAKVISSTAYQIATVMENEKNQRMDKMYDALEAVDSSLDRQVEKSEALARSRANKGPNQKALQTFWDKQVTIKRKQRYEEWHAADSIFAEAERREKMKKAEEVRKLQADKRARDTYRKQLDAQVKDVNYRSMEDMYSSMTEAETKMNKGLFRTCKIVPTYS